MKKGYLLIFVLAVGVVLNFVVPPFQSPDEPHHFGAILIHSMGEKRGDHIEREIIRMMDQNNWWRFVGMGRPEILPERISDVKFLMGYYPGTDFRMRLANITFFHFFLGKIVRIFTGSNIAAAYYFCRLISFFFILGALVLAFLGIQKITDAEENLLLMSFLFILFLPQFLLNVVSVNSDSLAIFLGVLFFYAVTSLFAGEVKIHNFVFVLLAAGLGFLTDRSTFLLIPLCLVIPFFLIRRKNYQTSIVSLLVFFLGLMILVAAFVNLFPLQAENSIQIFQKNLGQISQSLPELVFFGEASRKFLTFILDGFLLKYGWSAFEVAGGFYYIWRILVLFSMIGIGVFVVKFVQSRIKKKTLRFGNPLYLKLIGFFLLAVFMEVSAAWTLYGTRNILAQGRYIFPFILPVAFLFVVGIKTFSDLFHPQAGKIAIASFILIEFLFLNYCLWSYILPVFHLSIRSPHPGV